MRLSRRLPNRHKKRPVLLFDISKIVYEIKPGQLVALAGGIAHIEPVKLIFSMLRDFSTGALERRTLLPFSHPCLRLEMFHETPPPDRVQNPSPDRCAFCLPQAYSI
jgi:hypothetical protein